LRNLAYTTHYVTAGDCWAPAGGQVARCAAHAECVEGTGWSKKYGAPGRTRIGYRYEVDSTGSRNGPMAVSDEYQVL
jgi:hypothetical protein